MIVTVSPARPLETVPDRKTRLPNTTSERFASSETSAGVGAGGGGGAGGDGLAFTTAVAVDVAAFEPSEFVARTRTRSVSPTSADVTARVLESEPMMAEQLAPPVSQRSH